MMKLKSAMIALSQQLSKTIAPIFFAAGALNFIFNNPAFGFEGNPILNGVIFFIGYPITKAFADTIEKQINDEWDRAVALILLWFDSFMFFLAGVYSLALGTIPDIVGIPMLIAILLSSAVLLYRIWKYKWFG